MERGKFFILALMMAFLICACGRAAKVPSPFPKPPPYTSRIPATQRPYTINGKTYYPLPSAEGYVEEGLASWYGNPFHGCKTANGEIYDMYGYTAAHKTLPINTYVLVQNLSNGREIILRINDRGPFVKDRIIDLSLGAAKELDTANKGLGLVRVTALGEATSYKAGTEIVQQFLPHKDFNRGEFYVQIGAFVEIENAKRLQGKVASELRKQADIERYDRGDKVFFRVRVYAGNTLSDSRIVERQWENAGYPEAFLVAK